MAINVNLIPQLITLTATSTGKEFTLSANQIVEFYDNGNGSSVTYINNKGTSVGVNVDEAASDINTAAVCTQAVSALINGVTRTYYINSNRIVSFKSKVNKGDGVICLLKYKDVNNAPKEIFSKTSAATINSAAVVTYPIIVPKTSNTPATQLYINSLLVDKIVRDSSETSIVLKSATVTRRGTLMVAGTTVLTLSGGTKTTAATVLVTNTEIETATKTANGTGYTAGDVLTLDSGTGTAGTITVNTVTGGAITTYTLTTRGNYTANPTLTNCTVTGGTGTGATFTLVMGAKTVSVAGGGAYTVVPSNPVSTTGGGNDVTLNCVFGEGVVTGCQILYDTKGTAFQVIECEQTVAQVKTLQNGLNLS